MIKNKLSLFIAASLALSATSAMAFTQFDPAKTMQKGGFASVNANGNVDQNSNVKQVTHTGTGTYRVEFKNSVDRCVGVATLQGNGGSATPGFIVVSTPNSGRDDNSDTVNVSTFNALTQIATDEGFNIVVTCAKKSK